MLANLRIVGKLGVLVGGLSLVLASVAGAGIWGVTFLKEEIEKVGSAGRSATLAGELSRHAVEINRIEFELAAEPTAASAAAARREIGEATAAFRRAFDASVAEAGELRLRALGVVKERFEAYLPEVEDTLRTAEAAASGRGSTADVVRSALAGKQRYRAVVEATRELAGISTRIAEEEAAKGFKNAVFIMRLMVGLVALGLGAGAFLVWLLGARGIAQPIAASTARLRALAEGETDAPIEGASRKDEVGDIARTMAVFRENILREREREARERLEAERKAERAQRLAELTRVFEGETGAVVRTVATAATEMEATATGMAAGAEETQRQAATVAAAAEQASANVQTVAAAAEELAASVGEISRQVAESTRIAAEAVRDAERTGETVKALSENAQRISDVVRLISEIAGQTNLLALNATIEAARAGEAGKGFAVVASEVKNLAAQTAKATDEIAGQVSAVQGETARVVEAIRGMGEVIGRLSAIATSIAAAVEEQGAATGEIARNVQQAAAGTSAVTGTIAGVKEAASSSAAAAAQVQAAARNLSQSAETLKAQVERYLTEVKAA